MLKKLFAPVLGLPSDAQTLALAAEIGTRFHAHIDVGVHVRDGGGASASAMFSGPPPDAVPAVTVSDGRGDEAPLDPAVVETLER